MKKDCTNCQLAEFEKRPSGRRNLERGECMAVIDLPNSFADYRGDFPIRKYISKNTKPDCVLWMRKTN